MTEVGVPIPPWSAIHLRRDDRGYSDQTVKVLRLAGPVPLATLRQSLEPRLAQLPVLRWVPDIRAGTLPWWRELPATDAAEVAHACTSIERVPAHEALVAELLTRSLPPDRPLWRLVLVESDGGHHKGDHHEGGHHDRSHHVVLVVSHALLDGRGAALVLEALFGPGPVEHPSTAVPMNGRVTERLRSTATWPARMGRLGVRSARSSAAKRRLPERAAAAPPFTGAYRPWNVSMVRSGRGYAEAVFDGALFTRTARHHDLTFTELALAVVAGALTRVHGTPERDDLAVVATGTRQPGDPVWEMNRSRYLFASLATTMADPAQRARRISASTRAGKALALRCDPLLFSEQWAAPRTVTAVHRTARTVGLRLTGRTSATLVVSTVRGPVGPLAVAGVPVGSIVSGGILLDDLGLNITVWSALGQVGFSVVGRPELVDVDPLAAALGPALDELAAAAGPAGGPHVGWGTDRDTARDLPRDGCARGPGMA